MGSVQPDSGDFHLSTTECVPEDTQKDAIEVSFTSVGSLCDDDRRLQQRIDASVRQMWRSCTSDMPERSQLAQRVERTERCLLELENRWTLHSMRSPKRNVCDVVHEEVEHPLGSAVKDFNAKLDLLETDFAAQKLATNTRFREYEHRMSQVQDFSTELVGRLEEIREALAIKQNAKPAVVSSDAQREMSELKADMRGVQETIESDVRLALECIVDEYLVKMSARLQQAERRLGELENPEGLTEGRIDALEREMKEITHKMQSGELSAARDWSSDAEVQRIEESLRHVCRSMDAATTRRLERVERSLAELEGKETDLYSEKVQLSRRLDKTERVVQGLEEKESEILAVSAQTRRRVERVERQCVALEERVLVEARMGISRRGHDDESCSAISARAAEAFTARAQEPCSFLELPCRRSATSLSSTPSVEGQEEVTLQTESPKRTCLQPPAPLAVSPRTLSPPATSRDLPEPRLPTSTNSEKSFQAYAISSPASSPCACVARGTPSVRARSHDNVQRRSDGTTETHQARLSYQAPHSRGGSSVAVPTSPPMLRPTMVVRAAGARQTTTLPDEANRARTWRG